MRIKHEKLKKVTSYLEENVLNALEELAEEYSRETGQKWSKGAVIRLALSEFFSKRGKIL
jgi:hypothetical protein